MINKLFENKKYEPLRDMERFTQDMFNRIIDFQEKKHAAWDTKLSFDQRIAGLPLHNLIFSSADRDPTRFGPTIAPFYPLRLEIFKIANYVKQAGSDAVLGDYYPNNGFLGSLIAREGINTLGLRINNTLPNQIGEFYDNQVYNYTDKKLSQLDCDAVLVSWPYSETNPTHDILATKPKIIIYIYTEHKNQETGKRQTGSDDMFDQLKDNYQLIDHWKVTRAKDLLHAIWPDMTPNIEEHRLVRIYADKTLTHIKQDTTTDISPVYDWEKDLQMAELALEAKTELDMQRMMM
jgi:hypothetical protein